MNVENAAEDCASGDRAFCSDLQRNTCIDTWILAAYRTLDVDAFRRRRVQWLCSRALE